MIKQINKCFGVVAVLVVLVGFLAPCHGQSTRWAAEATQVTIVRDDWGIAHVYGKTDADTVFGMIYAQCEDDFNRVETNYLNAMGRLAEAEGEDKVYQDLRMKLFIDPEDLEERVRGQPGVAAEADGCVRRWGQLLSRQTSRGEAASDSTLRAVDGSFVYRGQHRRRLRASGPEEAGSVLRRPQKRGGFAEQEEGEPGGSNGIAIAPSNTVQHHALLLINPHTSFFFRSELQMVSEEGLDAYGAVTWGQFFIYQGFNERVGWMHTSSGVDAVDEYLETVQQQRRTLLLQVRG